MLLPLIFCVCSAFLLLLGFGGFFPRFFDFIGLVVVLFLSVSAVWLTIRKQIEYKMYIRVVSGIVIVCCLLLVGKSFYLHNRISIESAKYASAERDLMESRLHGVLPSEHDSKLGSDFKSK
jgi:Flp pilus assembly protein protease CpaA